MSKLITEMQRIGMLEESEEQLNEITKDSPADKLFSKSRIERKERQRKLAAQLVKQNKAKAAIKAEREARKKEREAKRKERADKRAQDQKELVAKYAKQNKERKTFKVKTPDFTAQTPDFAGQRIAAAKRRKEDGKKILAAVLPKPKPPVVPKPEKVEEPKPTGMSTTKKIGIGAAGVAAGVGAWQLYKWWKKKRDSAKNAKERAKATASMNKAKARAKRVKEDVTLDDLKLFVNEYEIPTKDDFEIVKEYINIIINGKQNTLAEDYLSRIN